MGISIRWGQTDEGGKPAKRRIPTQPRIKAIATDTYSALKKSIEESILKCDLGESTD
jgi:hypothetical protein